MASKDERFDTVRDPSSDAFARAVLEGTPAVIYVYDVKTEKSVYQNRRLGELLGHPPEAASALTEWQAFIHPDDAVRFPGYRKRLKTIKPGETITWEYRLRAHDGTWRWFMSRDVLLSSDEAGKPLLVVGNASDISGQKAAEARHELLAGELRHRSKNFAAIVNAIARQTAPKDPKAAEPFNAFVARLMTLLKTGDLVLETEPRVAPIKELLQETLKPFVGRKDRISFDGPPAALVEEAAGALALAVHELATNALKYGALSVPDGKIQVQWTREGERAILAWNEKEGPPVSAPTRDGFGMRVIRQGAPGGNVEMNFSPGGLVCRFTLTVGDLPA